jgi:hypothetical protein
MAGRIAYYGGIVTNGLVLALDAAKKDSYPGSGTLWRDISGNGNNGTLTNGPTFNSGNGGSIVFDGVNDFIELGDVLDLGTNSMTINHWVNLNNNNTTQVFFSKALAGAQNYRLATAILNTGKLYAFMQGNSGGDIVPTGLTTIPPNTWVMATFVFNRSSSISMYYNGVQETLNGTATISQWNGLDFQSINPFRLGAYTASNNVGILSPMNGRMGLTQVYFRALSASEILQNYNATKTRYL